jgi:anti-sigma factor RsiW
MLPAQVVHLRFSPAAAGKLAGAASPAQRRGAKGSAVNGPELDLKFKLASAVQYMAFLVAVVQLIRWAMLVTPHELLLHASLQAY